MTKADNASGGGNLESSGTPESESTETTTPVVEKNVVAYETHQKLLSEKKALAARLATFEAEQKANAEKALKDKEDWKALAEAKDTELKAVSEKLAKREEISNKGMKLRAILDAVGGKIDESYFPLIPVDMVEIDPDTGLPDKAKVAAAVKVIQTKYAQIITPKTGALPTSEAARGATQKLSYSSWLGLPIDEQKKRMKDVDKSTM